MDASMSSSTPTSASYLPGPFKTRDLDEVSIASDFSVIPESLVDVEGGVSHCRSISTASFLPSEALQPSLTAMELHAKVTFQAVQPTYFCDSDIAITYTLGSDVQAKSSDRVGLYRVGFSSPQEYIGYQWAPSPTPDHIANGLPLTVVFKASVLPKEVGEFYQFCYVTHEGHIVGVSGAFQLQSVGAAREMSEVEEDGMVVVKSRESVLHGQVIQLSAKTFTLEMEKKEMSAANEKMTKQLEEKTQQLNMCQHHLQALEVKMKRETAEKCELMGRIGQVVEEKGHLEDKMRTVERTLETEKSRADVSETKLKELEEAALVTRKSLEKMTLQLRSLENDLSETKDALHAAEQRLEEEKRMKEKAIKDLEIWTSTVEADQTEKNSLALKFSAVNEELIAKLEELEATRKMFYNAEEKLNETRKELEASRGQVTEMEGRMAAWESEKEVLQAREQVLGRDNTHLQASNTALKERIACLEEDQKNEQKGRDAAETIASDLSGRLQAAKAEYHSLALTNRKLVKKLKKMRQRFGSAESTTSVTASTMNTSTCSTSSWLHAEVEEEEEEEELELEEVGDETESLQRKADDENTEGETVRETTVDGQEAAPVLSQSCHSSLPSQHSMGGSCCTHSTQQLSDVVNKKMENIVKEFSQQIMCLKLQLQEKEEKKQQEEVKEEVPEVKEEPEEEQKEEEEEESGVRGVLYSNSFLPTAPTAPVFLPEGTTTTTPTTTSPTTSTPTTTAPTTTTTPPQPTPDPTPAPRTHCYVHKTFATPLTAAANAGRAFRLPPPLLPETTPTARQAAVLSQFTQQGIPTAPPGHESDDDDFHSTSDSDSPANTVASAPPSSLTSTAGAAAAVVGASLPQPRHLQLQQPRMEEDVSAPSDGNLSPPLMPCPLCPLSFPRGTRRLLEEHVNSHLEHVCPVCSEVFQRNCQERFQEHVESHFKEEEEQEEERQRQQAQRDAADTSGPWVPSLSAHLLEID